MVAYYEGKHHEVVSHAADNHAGIGHVPTRDHVNPVNQHVVAINRGVMPNYVFQSVHGQNAYRVENHVVLFDHVIEVSHMEDLCL